MTTQIGTWEMRTKFWSETFNGRDHLWDLDAVGMRIW